jgi:hypothetical protein
VVTRVQEMMWRVWWSAGDGVEGLMEWGRLCGEIGGGEGDCVERLVG